MQTSIIIDGKNIPFKSSGAVPKRYKAQFQRDFFKDLINMGIVNDKTNGTSEADQLAMISKIDFDVFYDIAWTLAKTADAAVPDPMTWLDSFDEFPIMEILPELQDVLAATIMSKKK